MINETKVSIEVPAIKVCQRPPFLRDQNEFLKEYDFFIFTLPSNVLLQIAKFLGRKESSMGVQREHKEDRDKQIGKFISSEHPFFPNSIIINIPLEYDEKFYDTKSRTLKFNLDSSSAYVIDGQHRLKAFESQYSNGIVLDMVVTAYFGLELPTIAEIFTRINFYQKPVNKSLVYDLLEFNKDPEFQKYKEAHDIVNVLNNTIGSVFYGNVKMLGTGTGQISQAAIVEAFSSRYKILDLLKKYNFQEKVSIINSYFNAAKLSFSETWDNSILTRSVGFNALVKVFSQIIEELLPEYDLRKIDFTKYTDKMALANIDWEQIKFYGGFKGVNTLADKFWNAVIKD